MESVTRVFAYGSLIWRPGFAPRRRDPAVLHGWSRRFWQGSTDHRGTPDAPGRVVTLVRAVESACHGFVFELDPHGVLDVLDVLDALDQRESGGYERSVVTLTTPDGQAMGDAWAWIAHPGNPHWAGPAEPDALVDQIRSAVGPSGTNLDYVLELADALSQAEIADPQVELLARWLRTR